MHFKRYFLVLLATGALLLMPACSKNKTGSLDIQFVPKAGTADLHYGTEYQNDQGQAFTMSLLRFYVSQLMLTGDEPQDFPDQYFSVDMGRLTISLPEIQKGKYTGLSFGIGVDQSVNHNDPTTMDVNGPLNPADSNYQHWAWNSGYIFIKLQGMADTTGDGVMDCSLVYHIGTDDLYRTANISSNFAVEKNKTTTVRVEVDVKQILKGLNFATEPDSHTEAAKLQAATKIADNLPNAFKAGN